jgi:hypothetical protein
MQARSSTHDTAPSNSEDGRWPSEPFGDPAREGDEQPSDVEEDEHARALEEAGYGHGV